MIQAGTGLAADGLTQGYANAQGFLGTVPGQGNALQALQNAYGQARGDLSGQYGQTQGFLGNLQALYQPVVQGGASAYGNLLDAIGANGQAGSQRAAQAFQGSLGYNAGLDTGLDAVTRSAAARGMAASGNTSRDLFNYAADYQNRQSQGYINNLSGLTSSYLTGLGGQASGLQSQAQASQNYGSALGSLGTGLGASQAGVFGQAAQNQVGFGQGVAGLQTGAANQYIQNNNALAQSQNAASANMLDLLGGAVKGFANIGGISGISKLFA